ncbi:MAG: S8 family serine peptidase [Bacteroidales bacterium]|nr:S8 family serine peptidase [Bacteroidales bacterium]
MKKILTLAAFVLMLCGMQAQQAYWVFLSDKQGTTFDPYAYFDAKAIERYQQCGADLYDITNYPLRQQYVDGVNALASEEIGCSRWMNAVGVMATPDQAAQIEALPYVLRVQLIEADGMVLAEYSGYSDDSEIPDLPGLLSKATVDGPLEAQLVRMGGKAFRDQGIDGKGIRIAVFDGGFPRVNTHIAFKHLRDNNQILKTWNFPNKKEDVYGWNSHGTMTLSCIAGHIDGKDLGLATGAEFLLARTEVNTEPFKEEVWWQMAVEWADKNGANVISSSLGYGKERHYTKDMDGTSYVAKAGNLAARKGMLVCNSAGNEADSKQWKTIITPSDADSVLCVGGIENSLTEYHHIEFSSYGPSADGRLKPNVCAFGYARTANVKNDHSEHYVHGTSFSCPLVAGFAACAWQASPGKTAMEMFRLIEQSGDLYPYYDYAFGYGVPQADFFVRKSDAEHSTPTFRFVSTEDTVRIMPLKPLTHTTLFYHLRRPADGELHYYGSFDITYMGPDESFALSKAAVYNRMLVVNLAGYTDSFALAPDEWKRYDNMSGFSYVLTESPQAVVDKQLGRRNRPEPSKWGSCATWRTDWYFQLGLPVKLADDETPMLAWSPAMRMGLRVMRAFGKSYCVGLGFEYGSLWYNYRGMQPNALEQQLGADLEAAAMDKVDRRCLQFDLFGIELFQRIRLVPLGLAGKGLHWDLGLYGNVAGNEYTLSGNIKSSGLAEEVTTNYKTLSALADYRFNYGVTTRISYDVIGIYARYRLNGIGQSPAAGRILLPRLEVGIQLQF